MQFQTELVRLYYLCLWLFTWNFFLLLWPNKITKDVIFPLKLLPYILGSFGQEIFVLSFLFSRKQFFEDDVPFLINRRISCICLINITINFILNYISGPFPLQRVVISLNMAFQTLFHSPRFQCFPQEPIPLNITSLACVSVAHSSHRQVGRILIFIASILKPGNFNYDSWSYGTAKHNID